MWPFICSFREISTLPLEISLGQVVTSSSWVFDLTISRHKREGIGVVLARGHVIDFGLVVVVVIAAALAAVVTVAGQRVLTGSLTLLLAGKEKSNLNKGWLNLSV